MAFPNPRSQYHRKMIQAALAGAPEGVPEDAPVDDTAPYLEGPYRDPKGDFTVLPAKVSKTGRQELPDTGGQALTVSQAPRSEVGEKPSFAYEPPTDSPEPAPPSTEAMAQKAPSGGPDLSKPLAWTGGGGYRYEYTPGPNGELGTIRATNRDGKVAIVRPGTKGLEGADAFAAILTELYGGDVQMGGAPAKPAPSASSAPPVPEAPPWEGPTLPSPTYASRRRRGQGKPYLGEAKIDPGSVSTPPMGVPDKPEFMSMLAAMLRGVEEGQVPIGEGMPNLDPLEGRR